MFESFTKEKSTHYIQYISTHRYLGCIPVLFLLEKKNKSHPKIVLNILAVGWGSEDTSNFFIFFILLVVFRHLILTLSYVLISRSSFNEKKKRKERKQLRKYVQEKKNKIV